MRNYKLRIIIIKGKYNHGLIIIKGKYNDGLGHYANGDPSFTPIVVSISHDTHIYVVNINIIVNIYRI